METKHDLIPATSWVLAKDHQDFLKSQTDDILSFGAKSALKQGGFGILNDVGKTVSAPVDTMQNARMTHCFSLASIMYPEYGSLADHGIKALLHLIQDSQYGGWFYTIGGTESGSRKQAYIHAFLALAGASAKIAKRPNADELLNASIEIIEKYFWSDSEGSMLESYEYNWTDLEDYRGANSNMHTTEAFLALAAATKDSKWLKRALLIVEKIIHTHAAQNNYGVIEHFDSEWHVCKDYNLNNKGDQFRPYGITPGHGFEWSRLLICLETELKKADLEVPGWLFDDAKALFDAAWKTGWNADGKPGIVYTVDFEGKPIIQDRMHWVAAEATAAAITLLRRTGNEVYETHYKLLWEYANNYLIDSENGSWYHNLDENNAPTDRIWSGKPDIYHILQCLIIPTLPLGGSITNGVEEHFNLSKLQTVN